MTSMEREEKEKVKKREKKLEDEETMQQATWVKYTFPIKHQVSRIQTWLKMNLSCQKLDILSSLIHTRNSLLHSCIYTKDIQFRLDHHHCAFLLISGHGHLIANCMPDIFTCHYNRGLCTTQYNKNPLIM